MLGPQSNGSSPRLVSPIQRQDQFGTPNATIIAPISPPLYLDQSGSPPAAATSPTLHLNQSATLSTTAIAALISALNLDKSVRSPKLAAKTQFAHAPKSKTKKSSAGKNMLQDHDPQPIELNDPETIGQRRCKGCAAVNLHYKEHFNIGILQVGNCMICNICKGLYCKRCAPLDIFKHAVNATRRATLKEGVEIHDPKQFLLDAK